MAHTLGKFDFRVFGGKKDALAPCVVLILQRYDDLQGSPAISPHLAAGEIDIYIAQLKADLDEVARKAKTALAGAN